MSSHHLPHDDQISSSVSEAQTDDPEPSLLNSAFNSGQHCANIDCHSLDFLPLLCTACLASFCKDHASVFNHNCHSLLPPSTSQNSISNPNQPSSSDPVKDLISSHRTLPIQSASSAQLDRNAKAKTILDKYLPQKSKTASPNVPIHPKKPLSPAIQLILLKRRAISGDPRKREGDVPSHDRWYGNLRCLVIKPTELEIQDTIRCAHLKEDGKPVWFSKSTIIGKVFDMIIDLFKPELISLQHSELRLCLFRDSWDKPLILTDQCSLKWGELVHDAEDVWLMRKSQVGGL